MSTFQRASRSTITAESSSIPSISCVRAAYKLINCADDTDLLFTNTNLSAYVDLVIKIVDSANCWQVVYWNDSSATSPVPVVVQTDPDGNPLSYADCTTCAAVSTAKIEMVLEDASSIGPEFTTPPLFVAADNYYGKVVITGSAAYKVLAESEDGNYASLSQIFASATGSLSFVFSSLGGTSLIRYYPIVNGVRVTWHSGNADTASSLSQTLDVVKGDMVQIGLSISTTGSPVDLETAYASDASNLVGKITYTSDTAPKQAVGTVQTAGPQGTFFTTSGRFRVYADPGIPWSIVAPPGVLISPASGSGPKMVNIDVTQLVSLGDRFRGVFNWVSTAFGVTTARSRPLWFWHGPTGAWTLTYANKVSRHPVSWGFNATAGVTQSAPPRALVDGDADQSWVHLSHMDRNPYTVTPGLEYSYGSGSFPWASASIDDNGALGDGNAPRTFHITGLPFGDLAVIQAGETALFTEAWGTLADTTSTNSLYFATPGIAGVEVSPNLTASGGHAVWDDSTTLFGSNPAKGAGKITDLPSRFGYFRLTLNFEIINFGLMGTAGYPGGVGSDLNMLSIGTSSQRLDIIWRQNGVMDVWYWNGTIWSPTASITPPGGNGPFVVEFENVGSGTHLKINGTTLSAFDSIANFLLPGATLKFGQVAGQFMSAWLWRFNNIELLTDTDPNTLPDPV